MGVLYSRGQACHFSGKSYKWVIRMDAHASQWKFPPEQLVLDNDEVHVWRAALDVSISRVQALAQTLAPDEQERASKFHFQKDRAHYIVARGLLRAILGRYYLSREPPALQFCYNTYGKPALAGKDAGNPLFFNTSHSHGMALYALARIPNIGVDIEHINRSIECEQIAGRFFSPFEVNMLRAVPQQMQQEAFFNCWTRKEAYIKARGMGLSLDLNLFDVSLAPEEPAAILNIREEDQDISRWSLYALSPGSGFKAALAVEGHPDLIKCWQWPEL
jgi:4'-phosphopantetheinyl transferase